MSWFKCPWSCYKVHQNNVKAHLCLGHSLEDRKNFLNMKKFRDLVFSDLTGQMSASDFSKSEHLCGIII